MDMFLKKGGPGIFAKRGKGENNTIEKRRGTRWKIIFYFSL